jgi:hypothetical protein
MKICRIAMIKNDILDFPNKNQLETILEGPQPMKILLMIWWIKNCLRNKIYKTISRAPKTMKICKSRMAYLIQPYLWHFFPNKNLIEIIFEGPKPMKFLQMIWWIRNYQRNKICKTKPRTPKTMKIFKIIINQE